MTTNPLLTTQTLPQFSQIQPQHIEPAIDQILTENRARLAALLSTPENLQWQYLIPPLENLGNILQKAWSPVAHLHAVLSSEPLRKAYHNCLPKLSAYNTEMEQNLELYQAFNSIANSKEFAILDQTQQKLITDQLRDFHLAGVTLPTDKKQRYADIQARLAQLSAKFEENILDATENWYKHIQNPEQLIGIPQHVLQLAQQTAQKKNLKGWVFTLEFPSYYPVLSYAQNRELRRELYTAYSTRASDQGPLAGKHDNSANMQEILSLRQELSHLLGFKNFAELSLATKMVKQPQTVLDFLQDLAAKAHAKALEEIRELQTFAQQMDGLTHLEPWDISYYSEKLSLKQYGIDEEMLRPYFPEDKVLKGLFSLTEKLYGMHIVEEKNIDVWHPDVRFFSIYDSNKHLRGQFYLDLYARSQKRGGAWMDDCQQRWKKPDGQTQTPIAFLTCNLTPPSNNQPALLTHTEVSTIFHEYGHGLHHMLTKVDYTSLAGIHGVEWDAVELPSQFMEFFTWEKSILNFISGHYQTGEPIPDQLVEQLRAAKNFHSGLKLLRQLEFALFDFILHMNFDPNNQADQIQIILDAIRKKNSVVTLPVWNRFQHSFAHIFSGGYAAGYYSYLWAEMLASDAFAKFEEQGILNPEIGQEFLTKILEKGGSQEALELFINFRGRKPQPEALLRHLNLISDK